MSTSVFAYYALPGDDLAPSAVAVTASGASPTDEDPDYPAEYLVSESPSRPAKLLTTSGAWVLDFGSAVTPVAAAVVYHNLDPGLAVVLQGNATDAWTSPSYEHNFTIPSPHEDGWPVSPWILLSASPAPSFRYWRLYVQGTNSLAVQVGRFVLAGALRDLGVDAKWGVVEEDDYGVIEQETEAGVETLYDLGGKRRRFVGELGLSDAEASAFLTLRRSAKQRVLPWLLIPNVDENDAWLVRFEATASSRTREAPGYNAFPFVVRELSRGLPWP